MPFSEKKVVTLYIVEVDRSEANKILEDFNKLIGEMKSSGMVLDDVNKLLEESNIYYEEINFLAVKKNYEKVKEIHDAAFESSEIIEELKKGIEDAENYGIDVLETKKILYVAEAAYNRGDYILSLSQLNEAKLTYAIETKGEFNILYTVKNNPLETFLVLMGVGIFSFASSLIIRLKLYKNKLRYLKEEEKLLLQLMKIIQKDCFEGNKMSMEEYDEAMNQYETKLSKTIEEKVRIETRIANLLKVKGKRKALDDEKKRIIGLIKDIQDKYLVKGELETRIYKNMLKSYSTRLSEVEEQITFLDAQDAMKNNKLLRRLKRKLKLR